MIITGLAIVAIVVAVVLWVVALVTDDVKVKGKLTAVGYLLAGFGIGWIVLNNILLILVVIVFVILIKWLYKKYQKDV